MVDGQSQGCASGASSAYRSLAERMTSIHISRFSELPRIELYLDQLLRMVDDELSFMRLPDESPLVTGSMVNNYVKRHVMPAPVKHRYTRRHVCYVLCVCLFKRVLSIEQVTRLIHCVDEAGLDLERAYDELCSALECALAEQFAVGPDFVAPAVEPVIDLRDASGKRVDSLLDRTIEAAVVSLAAKIYVEQILALGDAATAQEPVTGGETPTAATAPSPSPTPDAATAK
ncbi:MAG: DUF1836 domain-containing protein [Coriobacteriaceae bacterium]|uniref:DUF1836 domain-containing protein n=1 Tax=Tractidigestivibacter sp. TaxID=2847320 RepID=UPI002A8145D0|nr:DUF1836 domain-containing protein [Tractidigestivibacter sp.]MCI6275113.1 DUF1836 domain-containing protein [Coriobacteriaceae bacterium]MCI6547699.1 DUF1836 domain-containing protein [Coriobacteriaceae bacterium]MCI6843634.1 DUF1836 domain-containing protein [Coriobacteriaceae bacterium]MCI7438405.1 DUF1836 domain-containing protein [Coriobacteriaceae bacterium]MDD7584017.1 DUF1836 domain-containing protein [Coriobacteriaceae bacterium]